MPLNDKMPDYWFELAKHDIKSVKILIKEDGYPDIILYHMHQAIEKILKGLIIENRKTFPYIHDLERLFKILTQKNKNIPDITDDIIFLQSYYKDLRYPQADYISKKDLTAANKSFKTILEKLDFSVK